MRTEIVLIQLWLALCYGAEVHFEKMDQCVSELPPDPNSHCCGVDVTVNHRIIGGKPTSLRQYPWLGLVEYSRKHGGGPVQLFCGAFLISSRYVVTAAHCVSGSIAEQWKPTGIRLGAYNKTNPGQDCLDLPNGGEDCTTAISIPIDKVLPHEHYIFNTTSIANDIALIRLKKLAPYTDHIRPICLPPTDFTVKPSPRLKLHVAGWGTMKQIRRPDGYKNIDSKVKLHAAIPYMPFEKCRYVQRLVTKSHICAGGNGKDTCMGDSGGPLMFNRKGVYEAVGVVSYGPGAPCGIRGIPGVYTKVFDFKKWIMKHVK